MGSENVIDFKWLKRIFYIALACWVVSLGMMIAYINSHGIDNVKLFSDFGETLSYIYSDNPYKIQKAFYPPIAFLLMFPFGLICKTNLKQFNAGEITLIQLCRKPLFIFSYVLYFVINMAFLLFVIAKACKLKGSKLFYLLGIMFCLGPILYLFNRANVIITIAIFVFIFFWWYNSPKKWQRELSLVFLSLAISMKIYPVVLATIFIKDRRWADLFKTAAYSVLLVFVPFFIVNGGLHNITTSFNNFTKYTYSSSLSNRNLSVHNLVVCFFNLCGKIFNADFSKAIAITSLTLRLIFLISVLICAIRLKDCKKEMQFTLILVLCYILSNSLSYGYVLTLMLYPFMLFILNFKTYTQKEQIAYSIFYIFTFLPFLYSIKKLLPIAFVLPIMFVYAFVDLCKHSAK